MANNIIKNESLINEIKTLEILKLGEKFESIRAKIRIRNRDLNELTHLETKVKKYQLDIQNVTNRIDSEKSLIRKINFSFVFVYPNLQVLTILINF